MTAMATTGIRPFIERISEAPVARNDIRSNDALAALKLQASADASLAALATALEMPRAGSLLAGIFGGSPYLARLIERDPLRLEQILTAAPEVRLEELKASLARDVAAAATRADVMRVLRVFKTEVALLTALADLAGVWPVLRVTGALTECADAALRAAVGFLFREAVARGQWLAEADGSVSAGGYIVLAYPRHQAPPP